MADAVRAEAGAGSDEFVLQAVVVTPEPTAYNAIFLRDQRHPVRESAFRQTGTSLETPDPEDPRGHR